MTTATRAWSRQAQRPHLGRGTSGATGFLVAVLMWQAAVLLGAEVVPGPGDPARSFLCRDTDGKPFLFAPSWLEGETVVLSFFTPHCEPCRAEIPALIALLRTSAPHATVLLVGIEPLSNDVHLVARFAQAFRTDCRVLFDDKGRIAALYGVDAVPTTIVVAPDFTVALRRAGYRDERDLAELVPAIQKAEARATNAR